jgi:molybdopterin converting factor small subunit
MGSILKTRTLTTFAEGAILAIGVAIILTVVYFATLDKAATTSPETVKTDSAKVETLVDTVSASQATAKPESTVTNTGVRVPVSERKTETAKPQKVAKSKVAPKPASEVVKPKVEKPKQKKTGERENLEITNF